MGEDRAHREELRVVLRAERSRYDHPISLLGPISFRYEDAPRLFRVWDECAKILLLAYVQAGAAVKEKAAAAESQN